MSGAHRMPPPPRRHDRARGPLLVASLTTATFGWVWAANAVGPSGTHPHTATQTVTSGWPTVAPLSAAVPEQASATTITPVTSTFVRRSFVVTKPLPHTVTTQAPIVTPSPTTAAATAILAPTTPAVTTTAPAATTTAATTTTDPTTTAPVTTAAPTTSDSPTAPATAEVTATLEATP